MFILSLLLPLASVDAAYIQEAQPAHQSSAVQRVKTFGYSAVGTSAGLFGVSFAGHLINEFAPNIIVETVAMAAGNEWVMTAAALFVGGVSLYRSICKPVDNRAAVVQVVDAAVKTITAPAKAVVSLVDTWRNNAESLARLHPNAEARAGILKTLNEAPAPVFHQGGESQWRRLPVEHSTTSKRSRR